MSNDFLKPKLINIAHESFKESVASDCFTFGMLVGVVLVGKWVDSDALEWIGGLMVIFGVIGKAFSKFPKMTIDEARAKLDEIEGSQ